MTSLTVEEPPSRTGVRLRTKYYRTTVVLNILLISVLLKNYALISGVAFFGSPLVSSAFKGQ